MLLDGGLGQYFDYELNGFADLTAGGQFGGSFATAGSVRSPYRTRYLSWAYWEEGRIQGRLGLDRANIRFLADPFEASVGRLVINHSVTNIFTPNDFFAPFSATAVNRIYKPGVDAVHVGVAPTLMSHIGVDAVLGSDEEDRPAWSQSAVFARASLIRWNFEGAALGGKLADRWVVGASLQGELGPLGIRTEGHVGFPDRDLEAGAGASPPAARLGAGNGAAARATPAGAPPATADDDVHGRVAAGLELPLPWRSAMISGEYAYYSDGAETPEDYLGRLGRLFPDEQAFSGRHYAGASAGLSIMPLLHAAAFGFLKRTRRLGHGGNQRQLQRCG